MHEAAACLRRQARCSRAFARALAHAAPTRACGVGVEGHVVLEGYIRRAPGAKPLTARRTCCARVATFLTHTAMPSMVSHSCKHRECIAALPFPQSSLSICAARPLSH